MVVAGAATGPLRLVEKNKKTHTKSRVWRYLAFELDDEERRANQTSPYKLLQSHPGPRGLLHPPTRQQLQQFKGLYPPPVAREGQPSSL